MVTLALGGNRDDSQVPDVCVYVLQWPFRPDPLQNRGTREIYQGNSERTRKQACLTLQWQLEVMD